MLVKRSIQSSLVILLVLAFSAFAVACGDSKVDTVEVEVADGDLTGLFVRKVLVRILGLISAHVNFVCV